MSYGMSQEKKLVIAAVIIVPLVILFGVMIYKSFTLDDKIEEKAQKVLKKIPKAEKEKAAQEVKFEQLLDDIEKGQNGQVKIHNIKKIEVREEIKKEYFGNSQKSYTYIKNLETQIKKILKDNDDDDSQLLALKVQQVKTAISNMKLNYSQAFSRINRLTKMFKAASVEYPKLKVEVEKGLLELDGNWEKEKVQVLRSNQPEDVGYELKLEKKTIQFEKLPLVDAFFTSQANFPNKKDDLELRKKDYEDFFKKTKTFMDKTSAEYAKYEKGDFDIGLFVDYMEETRDHLESAESIQEELVAALEQLNAEYKLYLVSLERIPVYQALYLTETWDYYDNVNRYQNWNDISPGTYQNYQKKLFHGQEIVTHADSNYSNDGKHVEVDDVRIIYQCYAETYEKNNNAATEKKTIKISVEQFEDWYGAIKRFQKNDKKFKVEEFNKGKVFDPEDSLPAELVVKTTPMLIETKAYGQYEGEGSDIPTTNSIPSTVGNKEYGKWKKENSGKKYWEYYGWYCIMFGCGPRIYWGHYGWYDSWSRPWYGGSWAYKNGYKTYKGPKWSNYRKTYRGGGPKSGK